MNANVVKVGTKNLISHYVIQEKSVVDNQGKTHKLKIGYIEFLRVRKSWFGIKKTFKEKLKPVDIVKTAQKYVPEMKKKGLILSLH